MKKLLSLALSLVLTFGGMYLPGQGNLDQQISVSASAEVLGDYKYELLDDGTAALTGYTGTSSEVKLPETLGGKSLSTVKSGAFADSAQIKSISVPPCVKTIEKDSLGYIRDQDVYKKIESFIIYCYEGSAAEQYAKANEFEYEIIKCEHSVDKWQTVKAASCSNEGEESGLCSKCGLQVTRKIPIDKNAHEFGDWVISKPSTPVSDGQKTKTCIHCGKTLSEIISRSTQRIFGSDRYETAFRIADTLKANNGGKKFKNVIVASGLDSADALSAAYLAKVKDAPLLITAPADRITDKLVKYIGDNADDKATVYIIGGTNAVSQSTQDKLGSYNVVRVSGPNRYITNLLVLKEAGVTNQELLVASGTNYADALSASGVGKPILLVNGTSLNSNQRSFLGTLSVSKATIIGGTSAVSNDIQTQLGGIYKNVSRIGGANRYETSVNVAAKYFSKPAAIVLAYGLNFPDGLCGGPLAMDYKSPLILTSNNATAQAKAYAANNGIEYAAVLGGAGLISDHSVSVILSTSVTAKYDANSITLKWKKVSGAANYRVSIISPRKEIIAVTDKTTYTYKCPAATSYTFSIDALSPDGKVMSSTNPMTAVCGTDPEAVKGLSASSNGSSASLRWTAVKCSYYEVFKLISGSYQLIGTSTSNTYSDPLSSGSNSAEYKVRAVFVDTSGITHYGGYSNTAKITVDIKQAPKMLLSESGEHYIKLRWEGNYGISSYRVSIYKNSAWQSYTTTANSYTFDRLERSTSYDFKVCGIINSYSITKEVSFSDATNSTVKSKTAFRIYTSPNTSSEVLYNGSAGVVLTQKGKYSSSWYRVYVPGTNNSGTGFVQASQFGGYMNLNFGPISQLGWEGGRPLPTGCETTALATQLNRGLGLPCTKNLLADKFLNILPIYTGDPNYGSWGDPYTDYGYGVMAPALAETTNRYLKSIGVRDQYQIDVHTDNNSNMSWYKLDTGPINTSEGLDLEGIKRELELGHSLVIWWITRGDDPSSITYFTINRGERYSHDGTGTYSLRWVAHQHGSVITGYDETTNQFIIADVGWGFTVTHSFSHFMKIYGLQNRQSLVIYKKL